MVDIFLERLIEFICGIIPSLPFPAVRMRLKDPDDIGFIGSEWTTWKEWYGDLNQYFHVQVHNPVFYYCQRKMASRSIDINYDQARGIFYRFDKKYFDRAEEHAEGIEDSAILPEIESARSEYKENGGRPWGIVKEEIQPKE